MHLRQIFVLFFVQVSSRQKQHDGLVLIKNDLAEKQFETTVLTFFLLSKVRSPCVYSVNTPRPQSPQTRATDRSEAPWPRQSIFKVVARFCDVFSPFLPCDKDS